MPSAEPCRLYLITPAAFDAATFADDLAAALDAGNVACLRLELGGDDDAVCRAAERLVPICQARDVAFLLTGRPDLVAETGADGVHVTGPVEGLREALPEDAILGAGCGLSRHDALVAGDADADYVSFGPIGREALEIVAWWNQMVVLPSVLEGAGDTEAAARAAEAGADFVAVSAPVWTHDDGPARAVALLNAAITGT
jgi:thiamine-phosphate pyrophosphorylase